MAGKNRQRGGLASLDMSPETLQRELKRLKAIGGELKRAAEVVGGLTRDLPKGAVAVGIGAMLGAAAVVALAEAGSHEEGGSQYQVKRGNPRTGNGNA
jgi:hypothetical protein